MGCGISRFSLAEDVNSCSRPIRRRIDEMRRGNRTITTDANPSTKVLLLKDGVQDYILVDSNNDRKSVSSFHPINEIVIVKQPLVVKQDNICDGGITKKKLDGKERDFDEGKIETEAKKENSGAAAAGEMMMMTDHDEDDEFQGGRISDFDGPLFMGSPSFRMYCINRIDSDDSFKVQDGNSVGGNREGEIKTKESNPSPDSNELVQTPKRTAKKSRRGRRFRKVFPKGRPGGGAVRNLLQVTTCYNPTVPAHDRPQKPAEKSI